MELDLFGYQNSFIFTSLPYVYGGCFRGTLTYKALNGLTPEYITNMLTPNSQVHDRTLRSSVDGTLMVPRSRTSLYDKSFSVSAPKYWNSLPTYIKNAPSLSSFQTQLKDKLMHFT